MQYKYIGYVCYGDKFKYKHCDYFKNLKKYNFLLYILKYYFIKLLRKKNISTNNYIFILNSSHLNKIIIFSLFYK
jgi:hypothetical protein